MGERGDYRATDGKRVVVYELS
ncbi:hypothetical protein CCACVL1_21702 [Corchorus capsularis]|uniref:Uncharacterized protein n=1 Tax=Corchorus capsularis TaxID=210143 RepID=A0A1R3H2B9_COCAP|nr:hypothetical protein CCACVL1_21702 [Corchorus capsularis]